MKLEINVGNYNTLNDLSSKVCLPKETGDSNLTVLSMIAGITESKILTKHIPCAWKRKFDAGKCYWNQKWNNDKCRCECKNTKNIVITKKTIFGILLHLVAKMVNI